MFQRKCIRLSIDQDQVLRSLHRDSGIPDGQFVQRPRFWISFTQLWNDATGRSDSPEEVLHYIMTKRKKGKWFRFGTEHEKLPNPEPDLFSVEQWAILDDIYKELGIGADNFLFDSGQRDEMFRRFVARTDVQISPLLFSAAIVARRKAGNLPKTESGNGARGFNDMDDVA